MSDPRENCPWKCKHCSCYDGEIKRLTAERDIAEGLVKASQRCIAKLEARIKVLESNYNAAELLWWDEKGVLDDRVVELEDTLRGAYTENKSYVKKIKRLTAERDVLLKLLGEELGEAHSWGRALSDVEIKLASKAIAAAEKDTTIVDLLHEGEYD